MNKNTEQTLDAMNDSKNVKPEFISESLFLSITCLIYLELPFVTTCYWHICCDIAFF